MKTITLVTLTQKEACDSQLQLFERIFGASVEVTPELCIQYADQFDFKWAAKNLLGSRARADYLVKRAPIDADYLVKRAPIDADYDAKLAPIDADYWAKRAPIDADYWAKRASIDADYLVKRAPIDADYDAKLARLFAECYLADGEVQEG